MLGQVKPSVGELVPLYAVPLGASAAVSSVAICNQGGVETSFDLAVAVAGAADEDKQYIYRDHRLPARQTFMATVGFALAASDVLRCRSGNGTVSFNAFGAVVT